MAEAELTISTKVDLEFRVGEKTSAWLESIGWVAPVGDSIPSVEDDGSDMVEAEALTPSSGRAEAMAAMALREAKRQEMKALYGALLSEISSPNDRLLTLLGYFGVNMEAFLSEDVSSTAVEA
jgi:hypothetical protein